ncbi:LmeA family phospholipid-binding protein [Blastococcus tunisiensis]|uniref:DUF2993 domain-containing protein n=1 Tax=Blastococcus tunisiensis TaxID=1798228 RepID=A0A1I2K340_9ACTN|nr:DUF2993 domain-containing protein [Blastococcus sp. DSM 46838]SFF59336.1 Protein of unknown function [Blastococcus sp. DSM 46838]
MRVARPKVVAVVLAVVLGLLLLVDRLAVGLAEGQVAGQLAEQEAVQGTPEVDIRGFPFLTQALGGRYDDVRITLTAAQLGQPDGTRAEITLHGVQVPFSSVLAGSVQEVPVERVDGTATLSYALLSDELGSDTELAREGDGLRITRTVELLGRELPLIADGQVTLDGDVLVVDVDEASGAGIDVPDFLLDRAVDLMDLRYEVPELPFGLQLTGVSPADGGVVIRVEGTDTVLRALE